MYHYTQCGLAGIWLGSGVTIENNPEFGELVRITHLRDLHEVIGRSLVNLPRTLTGDEFRFLRVELDWSYRRLAQILGTSERSIAKWEKAHDKPVANRSAERILRQLYNDHIEGERKFREPIVEMSGPRG